MPAALRGCKWTNWEGGVRQTAVWAGGALPAPSVGKRFSGIAHVADIFVTLSDAVAISAAELASASAKGPVPLDGVSLWGVLREPSLPSPRTEVLLYGQGWRPDATGGPDVGAEPALNCSGGGVASGMAWHNPTSMRQFPAPNHSAAAADECAAACCAESNCSGWMLTTPQLLRPPCHAKQPCCWLVDGGKLSASSDGKAFSGASGRPSPPPPPPSEKSAPGALRVGNYKLIIGNNKYAGWYVAPEDDNATALALARSFCKLGPAADFPPVDAPNCEAPGCLFDVDSDPCETKSLASEQVTNSPPDALA